MTANANITVEHDGVVYHVEAQLMIDDQGAFTKVTIEDVNGDSLNIADARLVIGQVSRLMAHIAEDINNV